MVASGKCGYDYLGCFDRIKVFKLKQGQNSNYVDVKGLTLKFAMLHESFHKPLFMPCNLVCMHCYELKCVQIGQNCPKGHFCNF